MTSTTLRVCLRTDTIIPSQQWKLTCLRLKTQLIYNIKTILFSPPTKTQPKTEKHHNLRPYTFPQNILTTISTVTSQHHHYIKPLTMWPPHITTSQPTTPNHKTNIKKHTTFVFGGGKKKQTPNTYLQHSTPAIRGLLRNIEHSTFYRAPLGNIEYVA